VQNHEIGCVTQWVRTETFQSTDQSLASRSGSDIHVHTHNGVRSWMERECRPRDWSPEMGIVWTNRITLKDGTEGKADGFQWPEGSSLGHARESVEDTTGV